MFKENGMINKFLISLSICLVLSFGLHAQDSSNDAVKNKRTATASGKWYTGGTNTSFISVGQMGTSTLLTVTDGQTEYQASFGFLIPLIAEKEPNRPPVAISPTVSVSLVNPETPGTLKTIKLNGNDPDQDPIDFVVTEQPKRGTIEAVGTSGREFRFTPGANLPAGNGYKDTLRFKVVETSGELESEVALFPFQFNVQDAAHTITSFTVDNISETIKEFQYSFDDNVFNDSYEVTLSYISGESFVQISQQNLTPAELTVDGNTLSSTVDVNAEDFPDVFSQTLVTVLIQIKGGDHDPEDVIILNNTNQSGDGAAKFSDFFNNGSNKNFSTSDGSNASSDDGQFFTFATRRSTPENNSVELNLYAIEVGDYDLTQASISISEDPLVGSASSPILVRSTANLSKWTLTYTPEGEEGYVDSLQFSVDHTDRDFVGKNYSVVDIIDVNDAPSLDEIADQELDEDEILTVDATFEDVDSDLLVTVSSSDSDNIPVSINGDEITISPIANYSGVATISVLVEESGTTELYSSFETFNVEVNAVNDRPVLSAIDDQSIDEDNTFTYTLETTDIDAAVALFSYSVTPSVQGVSTISVQGNTLTVTPEENYNGEISFSITADDGLGTNTSISEAQTFDLTINSVNDTPEVSAAIPTQNIIQGFPSYTIDLGQYFEDVETADADLNYSVDITSSLFTIDITNNILTLAPISGQSGSEDITISASDGSLSASQTVTFNLSSLGANITTSAIADVSLDEDFGTSNIDLTGAFTDNNDANAVFTYTVLGLDNLSAEVNGNTLTLSSAQDFNGDEDIFLVASTNGSSAFLTFGVVVNPVNDGPSLDETDDQSIQEDFDLSNVFIGYEDIDTESDDLTFTVSSSDDQIIDSDNISVSTSSNGITISASPEDNANGEVTITVSIEDDGGLTDQITFDVDVLAINDAPASNSTDISDATEDQAFTFDPDNLFSDVDGDDLTYSIQNGPDWITITDNELAGTPTNDNVGSESITVIAEDASGATARKEYTITVINTNDAPTLLNALEDITASEDELLSSLINVNDFEDVDEDDLTLSASFTGADWLSFDATTNRFNGTPENDDVGTINITITATDPSGSLVSDEIVLTVVNTNDTPTDIGLSALTIDENLSAGTVIGALNTTDVDAGDSFSYYISDSEVEGGFAIDGANLVSNAALNFETNPTIEVTIGTVDAAGATYEEVFEISVQNVNDAPSDLAIDETSVDENVSVGETVGSLSSTDEDADETFTYSLVSGDGDTDNSSFEINSGDVQTNTTIDFETKSSYSIRVRTTDSGGLTFDEIIAITVGDVNESPSALAISNATIAENGAAGTEVGDLSTTDVDNGDSHTYSLVSGDGDTNNDLFEISSGKLVTSSILNFEESDSYSVRIKTADSGGLSTESDFTITVTDANDAPTDLEISGNTIDENSDAGSEIGTLSGTDEDNGETLSFSLVDGTGDTDNDSFEIDGDKVLTKASFDFETKNEYSIRVAVTDAAGESYEEAIDISIQNVAEPSIADIADLSFDPTPKRETSQVSFTIENTGDTPIEVTSITLPTPYTADNDAFTVAVGTSTDVVVTFAPTEAQIYSGEIVIQSTIGETRINVTGEGVQVTGIDDEFLDPEEANVYPNPTSDYIRIDLSQAPVIRPSVAIVDLKGQQMWMRQNIKEKVVQVDVRSYPVGTYLVKISSDKGSIIKKFIVIK